LPPAAKKLSGAGEKTKMKRRKKAATEKKRAKDHNRFGIVTVNGRADQGEGQRKPYGQKPQGD